MEWTQDLSVGVEEIDEQHKELFKRIKNLVDAIKNAECKYVIDGTISFLEEYAGSHFAVEEKYMEESRYEDLQQHKVQHAIFLNSLAELKKQSAEPRVKGSSYDLSVTTNQMVVDWIISHIVRIDKKLGEFLKSRGQA